MKTMNIIIRIILFINLIVYVEALQPNNQQKEKDENIPQNHHADDTGMDIFGLTLHPQIDTQFLFKSIQKVLQLHIEALKAYLNKANEKIDTIDNKLYEANKGVKMVVNPNDPLREEREKINNKNAPYIQIMTELEKFLSKLSKLYQLNTQKTFEKNEEKRTKIVEEYKQTVIFLESTQKEITQLLTKEKDVKNYLLENLTTKQDHLIKGDIIADSKPIQHIIDQKDQPLDKKEPSLSDNKETDLSNTPDKEENSQPSDEEEIDDASEYDEKSKEEDSITRAYVE